MHVVRHRSALLGVSIRPFVMFERIRLAVVVVVMLFIELHAQVALAGDCQTKKAKAFVKYSKAWSVCLAKYDANLSFDWESCEQKANARCFEKVTKAQTDTPCAVVEDPSDICNKLLNCQFHHFRLNWQYSVMDPEPSKCSLKRAKVLAKAVRAYQKCEYEVDFGDPGFDYVGCLVKADTKCSLGYSKVQRPPGCAVEYDPLDACRDGAYSAYDIGYIIEEVVETSTDPCS